MLVALNNLIALLLLSCVRCDDPTYSNGCVYVATRNYTYVMYYSTYLSPPFVNCTNLGLSSINTTEFDDGISSLGLSQNALKTFNASATVRFPNLYSMDLRHNQISSISSSNDNQSRVHIIYLGSNLLQRIPTNLFKSYVRLSRLDLFNNNITALEPGDFDEAKTLVSLTLAKNPIKQISDDAFTPITSKLFLLDMSYCGLTKVPTSTRHMSALYMLNLGYNRITSLEKNDFLYNTVLHRLYLSSNGLHTIHPEAFSGTTKLTVIEMSDNQIESLPQGLFDNMGDNRAGLVVELYGNPIRCDCKLQWLKLWTDVLQVRDEIEFSCAQPARNRGKQFYEIAAADLTCETDDKDWNGTQEHTSCESVKPVQPSSPTESTKADEITVCPERCQCYHSNGTQYNAMNSTVPTAKLGLFDISPFPPAVVCKNTGLTGIPDDIRPDAIELRLIGNDIKSWKIRGFKQLTSLQSLMIEGCGLTSIIPDASTTLPAVKTLDLQNNKLKFLTKEHLRSFPNMTTLWIRHNRIRHIHKDLFIYNRRLRYIFMGSNPIQVFHQGCFDGLVNLTMLSLRRMNLKVIPSISAPKLEILTLSDNAISRIANDSFKGIPQVTRIWLGNNQIAKVDVDAFKGDKALDMLDLSGNNITSLPVGVFNYVTGVKPRIEMWRNKLYCDCNLKWLKEWIEELEDFDPRTEVRFSCMMPWRMHAKTSDKLRPSDFVCRDDDTLPASTEDITTLDERYFYYKHGACYSGGHITLTFFLTVLSTMLVVYLTWWILKFRRNRNKFRHRFDDDTVQLELDM